ncbi:MAG: nuclear transport factor 2 family protein [Paracoccaceae bacterium]
MTPDIALLPMLEESLWRAATRYDPVLMGRTFAPDFFEFGRSGRRYRREELLFDPQDAQEIDATLHDLTLLPLSQDLVLVTYMSEVRRPGGTEWGNRSSIWDRSSGAWQLRFHQGTAIT